ncbi:hypothetical protein PV327_006862 [Microctonus hyperodae]|uniref:Uncharacterized protein n=1 Tax=Microctonus hyperodae TaxID=165561 RepID=A0AA39F561_MICHY|nr:hypothetical protein PV327_006862 [Microctonus hyperodae]
MILLLCFLTAFGLGRCLDQLQTREEIETSINRTITEVERLIKIDPSLPQLSRAEIVDILHNITSKDMESYEKSVENTRLDYQRALTVVLPYNSRDAKNEDIQNLFTKPPMIQIIPDSETMLPYSSIQEEPPVSSDPIIENLISTKYPDEKKNQILNDKNKYKNHRTTYDEPVKVDSSSQKFNSNFNNFNSQKAIWSTASSISKLIDSDKNDYATTKPKLQIVYSTSVTDNPTTKMFKTTTLRTNNEFRPTMPVTKSTVNILTSDQWKYFAPPSTTASTTTTSTTTTTTTTKKPPTTTQKSSRITTKYSKPSPFREKSQPFLPTVTSTSIHQWPTHPPRQPLKKRPELSSKAPDMITFDMSDVKMMSDESTPMLFVTPMSTKGPGTIIKPSSTLASKVDQSQKVSMTPTPVRKEVTSLLASIGLQPIEEKIDKDKISNNEINFVKEQGIFATNFEIPVINNTLSHGTHQSSTNKLNSSSIINQSTFNNAQKGVDNLSSDVQKLFQRFGLQTSESDATSTTTKAPVPFSFKANSWSNFKPLPKSEVKDATMKDFLATFGLGVENRNAKTVKMSKGRSSSVIEAVPSAMKSILENIGLIIRPKVPRHVQLKTTTTTTTSTTSTTEDPEKMHVFKPHEVLFGDPQQRTKINELLDTVKLVQEGEADVSDVRKVADDLLKTTKTLRDGPNPLNLDEFFKLYNDDIKNEVKRQESKVNLFNDTSTTNNSDSSESSPTAMIKTTGDNASRNSSDSMPESSISLDIPDDDSDARVVTFGVITTTSTEPTTTTTTTTESLSSTEDSNLDALADSFGGSTAEPDPVLPTPRKSGLYFLVDWNSFLEVGVDGEDKVNLKFAPKVGDRTRFIPVTVP